MPLSGQIPSTFLIPSASTPMTRWADLLMTMPPSRTFTLSASMVTGAHADDGAVAADDEAGAPAERAAGKLTPTVIRQELSRIVQPRTAYDPHLHYLDGQELYGEQDFAELPLPDQLHPDTANPPPHRRALRRTGFRARRTVRGRPAALAPRRKTFPINGTVLTFPGNIPGNI
jgi:hypothetical protein